MWGDNEVAQWRYDDWKEHECETFASRCQSAEQGRVEQSQL